MIKFLKFSMDVRRYADGGALEAKCFAEQDSKTVER
jgi:hypothetical protein